MAPPRAQASMLVMQAFVPRCAATSTSSQTMRYASTSSSSSSSSSSSQDIQAAQRRKSPDRRNPLPPSSMRSRVSSADAQLTTNFEIPQTNWNLPLHKNAAPGSRSYPSASPLPASAESVNSASSNAAIGPGATNVTSIRYAERSLHAHIRTTTGRSKPAHIGYPGTHRGIKFENTEAFKSSDIEKGTSLAKALKEHQRQVYLEQRGGDYSRFLSVNSGATEVDEADWEANASQALSFNPHLMPKTRGRFLDQVNSILEGKPFGVQPEAPAASKKQAVVEEAPAAADKARGKGKKK